MNGYIKSLNAAEYFGFIESEKADFFFHKSALVNEEGWDELVRDFKAEKNILVEFDNGYSPRGPRAMRVKRMDII